MPDEPQTPEVLYRLSNPLEPVKGEPAKRFAGGMIPEKEYNYLFRSVLSGNWGAQAAIAGHIIKKLNDKLRELNTPEYYHPDNESTVARLLTNLNFEPKPVADERAGLARPTNRKPRGSSGARTERGTTPGVRSGKPNKKNVSPDAEGSPETGK